MGHLRFCHPESMLPSGLAFWLTHAPDNPGAYRWSIANTGRLE